MLTPAGLFEYDVYCRGEQILEEYFAAGSGAKCALTAMDCGKSAIEAVRLAARRDPYTGGRIVSMSLTPAPPVKRQR